MTFSARWERLVTFVRRDSVVPIVGAGVSNGARSTAYPGFDPSVTALKVRLRDALITRHLLAPRRRTHDPRSREARFSHRLLADCTNHCNGGCDRACLEQRLENANMGRLAEVLRILESATTVVRYLAPAELAALHPTPAHGFIARLAREGLITNVFTTNYDLCLERAYQQTFRFRRQTVDRSAWPAVILDHPTYRRLAGARREGTSPAAEPSFHVFKLNGCAQVWNNLPEDQRCDEEARRLALTESDLHELESGWKRDLMRSVARTHTILLTGFGSDEPQVRYTILKILEEHRRNGGSHAGDPWSFAGAPFVHCYGAQEDYAHLHLLAGYASCHGTSVDPDVWNLVGGDDAHQFDVIRPTEEPTRDGALDADRFWGRLYADVIQRELADWLVDRRSDCALWCRTSMTGEAGRNDPVAWELARWLTDRSVDLAPWGPLASRLYPTPTAIAAANSVAVARNTWDEILIALRASPAVRRTGEPWGHDEYRPLRQHGALWAAMAFVIRAFATGESGVSVACATGAYPILAVPTRTSSDAEGVDAAFLVDSTAMGPPPSYTVLNAPGPLPGFAIHLPERTVDRAVRNVRRERCQSSGYRTLEARRVLDACAVDLVREVRRRRRFHEEGSWLSTDELRWVAAATPRSTPRVELIPIARSC